MKKKSWYAGLPYLYMVLGLVLGSFLGAGVVLLVFDIKNDNLTVRQAKPVSYESKNPTAYQFRPTHHAGQALQTMSTKPHIGYKVLGIKEIPIEGRTLDPQTQKSESLQSIMGGKPPSNLDVLFVEFRSSPLNYQGYQFMNNHLVLYGLDHLSDIRIARRGKQFILSDNHQSYIIEMHPGFRALNPLVEQMQVLNH